MLEISLPYSISYLEVVLQPKDELSVCMQMTSNEGVGQELTSLGSLKGLNLQAKENNKNVMRRSSKVSSDQFHIDENGIAESSYHLLTKSASSKEMP